MMKTEACSFCDQVWFHSKLVDEINNVFALYKDSSSSIAGNYYSDLFLDCIYNRKTIVIRTNDFGAHIISHLKNLPCEQIEQVIGDAMVARLLDIRPAFEVRQMIKEKRIVWRIE